MEVAPQELAQLLKLAGVGAGPEPDMPEPEMASEPEVSVMAIPSDDGAPIGGGCGAPEPEHEHNPGGEMRGIIDMLQGGGDEPIEVEESPPKDDYENASKEFTGHPVDVVGSYDQYSYEPAKNSGMQRRTNSYGDNPLREEDLIKEYTEFKKKGLTEFWNELGNWVTGKGYNTDQEIGDQQAKANIKKLSNTKRASGVGAGDQNELANKGSSWQARQDGRSYGGSSVNPNPVKTADTSEIHTIPGQQQKVRDQNALSKAPPKDEIEQHKSGLGPHLRNDPINTSPEATATASIKPPPEAEPKIDTDGTISTTDNPVDDRPRGDAGEDTTSIDQTKNIGGDIGDDTTSIDQTKNIGGDIGDDTTSIDQTRQDMTAYDDDLGNAEDPEATATASINPPPVPNQDMTAYDDDLGNDEITGQNAWMNKFYKNQGPEDPRATAKRGPTADEIKAYQNQTEPEATATASINPDAERPAKISADGYSARRDTTVTGDDQPAKISADGYSARRDTTVTGDDQSAMRVKQGGTDAGTQGPTAGGTDFDTTPKLASISTDKIKDMSGPEILNKIDQEKENPSQNTVPKSEFNSFDDAFAHYRKRLGKNKKFKWLNPKTGQEKWFTTDQRDDPHVPKINDSVDVGLGSNINRLKVLAGI